MPEPQWFWSVSPDEAAHLAEKGIELLWPTPDDVLEVREVRADER